jgi:hypothetical protein
MNRAQTLSALVDTVHYLPYIDIPYGMCRDLGTLSSFGDTHYKLFYCYYIKRGDTSNRSRDLFNTRIISMSNSIYSELTVNDKKEKLTNPMELSTTREATGY